MSTWKTSKESGTPRQEQLRVPASADAEKTAAAPVDVEVLEIAVDAQADCDPYNRTGQFCVPAFDKRDN